MGAAAAPIIASVIGGGAGVATTYMAGRSQKKAYDRAKRDWEKNRYMFSDAERAAARAVLMRSLYGGYPFGGGGAPRGSQQPGSQQPDPQQVQFQQFMKMVQERYSRPSPQYQGYLESIQERRDARGGIPAPPPQGGGDVSAQRRIPSQSGRTY